MYYSGSCDHDNYRDMPCTFNVKNIEGFGQKWHNSQTWCFNGNHWCHSNYCSNCWPCYMASGNQQQQSQFCVVICCWYSHDVIWMVGGICGWTFCWSCVKVSNGNCNNIEIRQAYKYLSLDSKPLDTCGTWRHQCRKTRQDTGCTFGCLFGR